MTSGHRGQYWLGTYETALSDKPTGTLTSLPFTAAHPYASFLIGGGSTAKTRVEITNAASGKTLFIATGPDNEQMQPVFLDLRAILGAKITIRLIDEATTGWGHLNFDDFQFHDTPPPGATQVPPAE